MTTKVIHVKKDSNGRIFIKLYGTIYEIVLDEKEVPKENNGKK